MIRIVMVNGGYKMLKGNKSYFISNEKAQYFKQLESNNEMYLGHYVRNMY